MFANLLFLTLLAIINLPSFVQEFQLYPTLSNVLLIYALIPEKEYYLSLNSVSWSILAEFVFYLAFPILAATLNQRKTLTLLFLAGILLLCLFIKKIVEQPSQDLIRWLFYFNPGSRIFEFYIRMIACQIFLFIKRLDISFSFFTATLVEIAAIFIAIYNFSWSRDELLRLMEFPGGEYIFVIFRPSAIAILFAICIIVLAFQKGAISLLLLAHVPPKRL